MIDIKKPITTYERISLLLRLKKVTTTAFAAGIGISRSSASQKLRGKVSWSGVDIAKTAEFLGVSSDQLLGLKPLTVTVD